MFSTEKPNVIVGPNGAGKSALLKALSLMTLSHQTGASSFDSKYVSHLDADNYWASHGYRWDHLYTFLPGLSVDTDYAPALYYRPGHVPGNQEMVSAAMMSGYFDEAREYGTLTRNRSSGQGCSALLARVIAVLEGDLSPMQYRYVNWRYGTRPVDLTRDRDASETQHRAEVLKQRYGNLPADVLPVILLDEPEQSLDAMAEMVLWRKVATADSRRVQVIAASHSLYPLMHPEQFNLIEAVPGYLAQVLALL